MHLPAAFLEPPHFGPLVYEPSIMRGMEKAKIASAKALIYNQKDNSVNQLWPGIVAGEWHNNHHLFPKSARSGFKPHQVDLAWYYIKMMSMLGAVSTYKDFKKQFYEQYYEPYLAKKAQAS